MTKAELLAVAKPILFNTEMVRAILEDRKTVTRRVVKPQPTNARMVSDINDIEASFMCGRIENGCCLDWQEERKLPYHIGDYLYVRETWYYENHMYDEAEGTALYRYVYRASQPDYHVNIGVGIHGWRPSIHMPKEAARIFLRVTDVRAEHIGDITEMVAKTEGFYSRAEFITAILKMYPECTEDSWIWVIEFERVCMECKSVEN